MSSTAETRASLESRYVDDLSDYEAEHILIADELVDEVAVEDSRPEAVVSTHRLHNQQTGRHTELTLYQEGFVRYREGDGKRVSREYYVELEFLDPRFRGRLLLARGWLALFALSIAALASAILVLPATELAVYRIHIAGIAGMLSLVGLQRFLKRTGKLTAFITRTGRAPVIRLVANLGCMRETRKAAVAVREAIRKHQAGSKTLDQERLREEMKIHYRLAAEGAISQSKCSKSATRILSRFE